MTRIAKYSYRRRLPHLQRDNKPVFVTFRTISKDTIPEAYRGLVLQHCLHDNHRKLEMHAVVVMPDHVHLLFTPLNDTKGQPFSLVGIMSGIKGASAHSLNKARNRRGPVWQEESFDHVLRSAESLEDKIEYIALNPVAQKLVKKPGDYRWLWIEEP